MTVDESMPRPSVGVAVILQTPQGYPLLCRLSKHANNEWCWPGGHLEGGETVLECAIREVQEEVGIVCDEAVILPWFTQDFFPQENKHYITLYVWASTAQKVKNMEPTKCSDIKFAQSGCNLEKLSLRLMTGVHESWVKYTDWQSSRGDKS